MPAKTVLIPLAIIYTYILGRALWYLITEPSFKNPHQNRDDTP